MPNSVQSTEESEPVGIVISRGTRDEPTPAVFAYVWGPAPDAEDHLPCGSDAARCLIRDCGR